MKRMKRGGGRRRGRTRRADGPTYARLREAVREVAEARTTLGLVEELANLRWTVWFLRKSCMDILTAPQAVPEDDARARLRAACGRVWPEMFDTSAFTPRTEQTAAVVGELLAGRAP